MIIQPMQTTLDGVARLSGLGVIRVTGEDATRFLQAQLTQDFALLGPSEVRLCAFCSAKGRMQASFIGLKRAEQEVLLLCSQDLLPTTLKRLSMFVLRSKVKLEDATGSFNVFGLAGSLLVPSGLSGAAPWSKIDTDGASIVKLYPADQVQRALWLAPADAAPPAGPAMAPELWAWSEVRSGVVTLTLPIVEAFVPQMLNFESVGGVNFKKGCYPGQEVVARSQFRGTLKRRAYLIHCEQPMQVGQELFEATDQEQSCGLVAQTAAAPNGGWDAIASMQIAAAQLGNLTLGSAQGPALTLLPLPYPLLADI